MHPGHHTEFKPRALRAAVAGGAYAARAFGSSRRDLDLDLAAADRPALVTQALAGCLSGFEPVADAETVVWEWTVAERLQGLLAIAIATDDAPSLQTRCTQGDCRTEMQIELDLAAFVAEAGRDPVVCALDGSELVLRLPRGSDQRQWRDAGGDAGSLAIRLIESIDRRAPEHGLRVPPGWIERLGAALPTGLDLHARLEVHPRTEQRLELSAGGRPGLLEHLAALADPDPGVQIGAYFLNSVSTGESFVSAGCIQIGSPPSDVEMAAQRIRDAYRKDKTFGGPIALDRK